MEITKVLFWTGYVLLWPGLPTQAFVKPHLVLPQFTLAILLLLPELIVSELEHRRAIQVKIPKGKPRS